MQTAVLQRYKRSVPFSQRLNDWIESKILNDKSICFLTTENDVSDFEELHRLWAKDGMIRIWGGQCDPDYNIFSSREINILFRAWHDSIHLKNYWDFSATGEALTAFAQMAELPEDWHFERNLILIEVLGQWHYHAVHGEFVVDQRQFTINCLKNGIPAK